MSAPAGVGTPTSEELLRLHNLTNEVARVCRSRLQTYLDAMAPLFRPRRVLGEFVEGSGRESVSTAVQNLAELKETYLRVCSRPFGLRRELVAPIESPPTEMRLYEWEYIHAARAGQAARHITITSPLRWVLAYPSVYSLSMMRQVIRGRHERDYESVRSFVLRSCILSLLFAEQRDLAPLIEGLRYTVELRESPELGELPLVTIAAPVSTERPCDELLLNATGLSGRAVFQEIIVISSAAHIPDPFREEIEQLF
jgi:hypothetical protein